MIPINFSELSLTLPKHRLDEYFGVWAVLETEFRQAVEQFGAIDLRQHFAEFQAREPGYAPSRPQYQITNSGVAVIEMVGTMMKQESSMGGASTVATRRALRAAAADESVRGIVLVIDSPGGTVSGTSDLAADVRRANEIKPTDTFFQDTGASAAYWTGAQGRKVWANSAEARIGSIGTFTVLRDTSELYGKSGVAVHVVKAGEFKGIGESGAPITGKQLEVVQTMINDMNEQFIKAVAKGRGVSLAKVREWADGSARIAAKALDAGMIDGITSLEAVIEGVAKARKRPMKSGASASAAIIDDIQNADDPQESADGDEDETASVTDAAPSLEESITMPEQATNGTAEVAKVETAKPIEIKGELIAGPRAATYKELKAACFGATPEFITAQLDAEATVETAQVAWQTELVRQRDEANAKANAAAKENETLAATVKKPGVDPVVSTGTPTDTSKVSGDPEGDWAAAVDSVMTKKRITDRAKATRIAAKENPELRHAYLVAVNSAAGRPLPA